ncbi:MAG: hypothetical protein KDC54_16045 [Lewinella sp.]|nr:hypothetical protein [Lewinella sp.]
MEQDFKEKFIAKLEEKYGPWDKTTSGFGATSFGTISRDLSISASQFSKLIYGTATEGMYQRSIENINRLILRESIASRLEEALNNQDRLEQDLATARYTNRRNRALLIWYVIIALVLGAAAALTLRDGGPREAAATLAPGHPLDHFFDQDFNANFDSPYLDIAEVQDFCPCSAYEGAWSLSAPYKLPLPGSRRPGLYYLAKSADVRMKCSRYDTVGVGKGRVLSAYEFLVNEIWLDMRMTPLVPRYFDQDNKTFTPEFEALRFEENSDFRKLATIHSFFTDRFEIYPDSIVRKGEPCGRFAYDVDQELAAEYEIDVRYILTNVLGDLTATQCSATANPFCNPNDLREGESVFTFDCNYTIGNENLGIGGYPYQKGYRLEQQHYADNLLCNCPSE